MFKPRKDRVGLRFGRLVILSLVRQTKHQDTRWVCRCACGVVKEIDLKPLREGKVFSCGCSKTKEIGEAAFNSLYGSYSRQAKIRNLVFSLNREEFKSLIEQNCSYCNGEPSNEFSSLSRGSCVYSGIDRVDNTKGYILSNCLPCCKACNNGKGTLSLSEWEDYRYRMYKNYRMEREEFEEEDCGSINRTPKV